MGMALGLLGIALVVAVLVRWWRRRGSDVSATTRTLSLALAATALVFPMLVLAATGRPGARWWLFAVPIAWVLVGVVNVREQRQARTRDLALDAPLRPMLWHPWLVGVSVCAGLFLAMLCALVLVLAIMGDVSTSVVAAMGGAVICGTFVLAWTQTMRRSRAAGQALGNVLAAVEAAPARTVHAASAPALGAVVIVISVMWASTLSLGAGLPQDAAVVLASTPGWFLVGLGWAAARPHPPISDEAPAW